jgi:hypothetical protein
LHLTLTPTIKVKGIQVEFTGEKYIVKEFTSTPVSEEPTPLLVKRGKRRLRKN